MSDKPPTGVVSKLEGKLIESLPAQFILLVILNILFLGAALWFLNSQNAARDKLLAPLLASCTQQPSWLK